MFPSALMMGERRSFIIPLKITSRKRLLIKSMLLYVTGSFPENQEGIASGAKVLLDVMADQAGAEHFLLLTTNTPVITESIDRNAAVRYELLNSWKVSRKNINRIERILDDYPITAVHMEYPGDLYGKTFLASFFPLVVHRYNRKKNKNITFNVRLHEFTRARFLRKIAILPLLFFSDRVYVPAQKDREVMGKIAGKRVVKTTIGTNIKVVEGEKEKSDKIRISWFGSVYPGKGIERMLRLWKAIKEGDREDQFRFTIIGDIGTEEGNHFKEYHEQIWELIDDLNLRDTIRVTGFVSDEEVSKEIRNTDIATLLFEDGLTLRRGSFLAYLAHGIPIVTTMGDDEAIALFSGAIGIRMTKTDDEAKSAVWYYSDLTDEKKEEAKHKNIELAKNFDWKEIGSTFLKDYGIL